MADEEHEGVHPKEPPTVEEIMARIPRPAGPDIDMLQDLIVNRLPREISSPSDLPVSLKGVLSDETLVYVAMQRAVHFLGIEGMLDLMARPQEVNRTATTWMEGFVIGIWFQQESDRRAADAAQAPAPEGMDAGMDIPDEDPEEVPDDDDHEDENFTRGEVRGRADTTEG